MAEVSCSAGIVITEAKTTATVQFPILQYRRSLYKAECLLMPTQRYHACDRSAVSCASKYRKRVPRGSFGIFLFKSFNDSAVGVGDGLGGFSYAVEFVDFEEVF